MVILTMFISVPVQCINRSPPMEEFVVLEVVVSIMSHSKVKRDAPLILAFSLSVLWSAAEADC